MRKTGVLCSLLLVSLASLAVTGTAYAASDTGQAAGTARHAAGAAAPHAANDHASESAQQPAAAGLQSAAVRLRPGLVTLPVQGFVPFRRLPRGWGHSPVGGPKFANQLSTNWSGYGATGGTYKSVSASWVEPTVTCNTNGVAAFWVGLDGWGSSTVEQDGSGVDCSSGSPVHFAWWETYPTNAIQAYNRPVAAGDRFYSTVISETGGRYELILTDATQRWSQNAYVLNAGARNASAEVIAEAVSTNNGVTPLPNFHAMSFSSSQINGGSLQAVGAQGLDMVDNTGATIASTGPADTSGDFTVTYIKAPAASPLAR